MNTGDETLMSAADQSRTRKRSLNTKRLRGYDTKVPEVKVAHHFKSNHNSEFEDEEIDGDDDVPDEMQTNE